MKYIVVVLAVLAAFTSAMKFKTKTSTCPPAPFTTDACFNSAYYDLPAADYFKECKYHPFHATCVDCCSEPFCNSDELDGLGNCPSDTEATCQPGGYAPCVEFCYFLATCTLP